MQTFLLPGSCMCRGEVVGDLAQRLIYCPLINMLITVLPPIPATAALMVKRIDSHICWVFSWTEGSGLELLPLWLPGNKIPICVLSSGALSCLWHADGLPSLSQHCYELFPFIHLYWHFAGLEKIVNLCTWFVILNQNLPIHALFFNCNYGILLEISIKVTL